MILKKMKSSAYLIRANGTYNYNIAKGKPHSLAPQKKQPYKIHCCATTAMYAKRKNLNVIHTWDAFICIINRLRIGWLSRKDYLWQKLRYPGLHHSAPHHFERIKFKSYFQRILKVLKICTCKWIYMRKYCWDDSFYAVLSVSVDISKKGNIEKFQLWVSSD